MIYELVINNTFQKIVDIIPAGETAAIKATEIAGQFAIVTSNGSFVLRTTGKTGEMVVPANALYPFDNAGALSSLEVRSATATRLYINVQSK
jgi:hypothetical protein